MKPINWNKIFNWHIWQITKWIFGLILIIFIWSVIVLECPTINYFDKKAEWLENKIIVYCRALQGQLRGFYKSIAK